MFTANASLPADPVPLCVDLDGTLIKSDVLWESMILLLKRKPWQMLAVPFWLLRGRAYMKERIAAQVKIDPATLPYHAVFLDYLREERRKGRELILATAADHQLAQQVADHIGLFSSVMASNGELNLRGKNKGRRLSERFGRRRFDYAGNSTVDLPVWAEARRAVVVNAPAGLADRARKQGEVDLVFDSPQAGPRVAFQALRPHQWVKNLIVFVPLLTSHSAAPKLFRDAVLAFIAFSLCASGVYVLNDLLDLEADRRHPTKCFRPFASGHLPLPVGLVMFPAALALSLGVAMALSWTFLGVLAVYLGLTTAYSWRLKQIALVDVFCLAGLYTIRLVAGHAATGIAFSFWLLAFSMFIFLSLALLKRYTELQPLRRDNKAGPPGRGYVATDLELVAMLGIANGFLAVMVMALYVNSPEVRVLYHHPIRLLLICPLLLFWISRVWLVAHRGRMHDDPIVFALKDGASYALGILTLAVLWLAT